MKVEEHYIKYKTSVPYRIVFFGDIHIGHRLCSVSNFKTEIIDKYRNEKNTFFFDMGDSCDMIVAQTRDPRFKASMVDPRYLGVDNPVDLQVEDYCDLVAPIADRLLGICGSNHMEELLKRTGTNPHRAACYKLWQGKEAEKRYLSWENFYALKFRYDDKMSRVRTVSLYLSHGITTGGRTEGGHITSIGNVAANYHGCDIYAFGHNHQLEVWDRVVLRPNYKSKMVEARKLVRLNTGTWLKSRSDTADISYPEGRE